LHQVFIPKNYCWFNFTLQSLQQLQRGKHAKIFYFKGEQRSRQADENPYENCDWERKKKQVTFVDM